MCVMATLEMVGTPWLNWPVKNLFQNLNQKQNSEPMSRGRGWKGGGGSGAEWLIVMLSRLKRAGQVL